MSLVAAVAILVCMDAVAPMALPLDVHAWVALADEAPAVDAEKAPKKKRKSKKAVPAPPPAPEPVPVVAPPPEPPPPPPAPVVPQPPPLPTVVVMPLEARGGVSPDLSEQVTAALAAAAGEIPGFKVTSFKEVQSALSQEALKMTAGCDSVSCAAEIAGALNTDFVIVGTLGKVGEEYVLALSRVGARDATTAGRSLRRFPIGRENLMLNQMPLAACEALNVPPPPELLLKQKALEAAAAKKPSPVPWVLRTVAGGVGAVMAVGLVATLASAAVPTGVTLYDWRNGINIQGPHLVSQNVAMLSNVFLGLAVGGAVLLAVLAAAGGGVLGLSFAWPG